MEQYDLSTEATNFFHDVVRRTKNEFVAPDDKVVKIFEKRTPANDFMYLIEEGECVVSIDDKDQIKKNKKPVRVLRTGDYFGEVSFIYNAHRSATVTANNYCTLGKIPADDVNELLTAYPIFKEQLTQRCIGYDDDLKIFLQSALQTIEYLKDVPLRTINRIIYSMEFAKFDKGQMLFFVEEKAEILNIV